MTSTNNPNPPPLNPAYSPPRISSPSNNDVPVFSSPEPEIHFTMEDETTSNLSSPGSVNHAQATNSDKPDKKAERRLLRRQVGGAAAVAGVAGLVVVGPIVGVLAAGGAAAGAALGKGPGGKIARGAGGVAADAGDRIKKIDEKHQISKKTATGVSKGYNWVSSKIRRDNNP
jgi:hypothetical protein